MMTEILQWCVKHRWALVPSVYAVMSLVTYVMCAIDKHAAKRGDWRTPESTLHTLELLGGWPGGLLGQRFLHHKCSKVSYQIGFYVMVVLNLIGLTYVIYGMWSGDWPLAVLRKS